MLSLDPKDLSTARLQGYLQSAVAPRPIALASTITAEGEPNLSPFSFFNVFSAHPPILIFSPARRVRDNTVKHTLTNVQAIPEVVINVVSYAMVQQTSLSSTEYADGVNEFAKAGFTELASDIVKPYRVQESPVQFECRVNQIIPLGTEGGAGNLVICEVLKIHLDERVLDQNGAIDQHKIDLVARLGSNWYTRSNSGLFEVPKPLVSLGIGVDAIPEMIRKNPIFEGNDLGMLGNVEALPSAEETALFVQQETAVQRLLDTQDQASIFAQAKEYLQQQEVASAWKILLAATVYNNN